MHEPLEDSTQAKARELARQITVAHDLDPEIQEELYGHIEDKMLAYKSGEERVSDEDAFILVREHFGDAKVIRGLLREVHAGAVTLSLGRRIGAACIITLAVAWLCRLLALPCQGIARALVGDGEFSSANGALAFMLYYAPLPIFPLGVALVFLYWRKREDAGNSLWFHRWRVRTFFQTGALLMTATHITPAFEQLPFHALADELAEIELGEAHTIVVTWVLFCWLCVSWLWWCDVSLRRPGGALYCLAGWMGMMMLVRHVPLQVALYAAGDSGIGANTAGQFTLFGMPYRWSFQLESVTSIMHNLSRDFLLVLLIGISSLLLYALYAVETHFRVFTRANAEYPRPVTGPQITGICFLSTMTLWTLFRDQPWTKAVMLAVLVASISLATFAVINLVHVPRASASGIPSRARALRHTANGFLCLALLFPLYHHDSDSTADGIERSAFLAGTAVAILWIVASALTSWWKYLVSNQGRDALVRE
ncbi:MAG: hypothetical protein KF886_11330 [Candidatus Hydrogenedentes bacterium]|nr:hypothetical protein [Candidatus Hydrogenedentota bacterium]